MGDVVGYAVNADNLADDARKNASQQLVRKLCPVSGRSVANSTARRITGRAYDAHRRNGLNVEQYKVLPNADNSELRSPVSLSTLTLKREKSS